MAAFNDLQTILLDQLFMKVAVEARVPILDRTLVEFCLKLLCEMLYKNGIEADIEKYIPDSLISQDKKAFLSP